jgi:hypothetical protein
MLCYSRHPLTRGASETIVRRVTGRLPLRPRAGATDVSVHGCALPYRPDRSRRPLLHAWVAGFRATRDTHRERQVSTGACGWRATYSREHVVQDNRRYPARHALCRFASCASQPGSRGQRVCSGQAPVAASAKAPATAVAGVRVPDQSR